MVVAVAGPPSTQRSPSLYNSYRRLLVGFSLLWLHEHSKSREDVREADTRELSWAVGDGQTQHHALGHLRIRIGAAESIGSGNVGTTQEVIGQSRFEKEVANVGTTANELRERIHIRR